MDKIEGLYEISGYTGKLPNPKSFPMQGAFIIAFDSYPDAFSDGFFLDLSVSNKCKQRLQNSIFRLVSRIYLDSLLGSSKLARILLQEPKYIHDGQYLTYVLQTPYIKPIGIQVKYYHYFRNRYPNCQFFTDGERATLKSVRVEDTLVGLFMPVTLPFQKPLS